MPFVVFQGVKTAKIVKKLFFGIISHIEWPYLMFYLLLDVLLPMEQILLTFFMFQIQSILGLIPRVELMVEKPGFKFLFRFR